MNRSTLILLLSAAGLAVLTWFFTQAPAPLAAPRLDLPGFATPAELEAARTRSIVDEAPKLRSPIDELVIEWPGRDRVVLKRIGNGEETAWRLVEPVDAPAHTFLVDHILTLFMTPTQSREARPFVAADARLYGMETKSRARLTAKAGGAVWNGVDLYLGDVRRPRGEDRSEPDTWVMPADRDDYVFAVHAKDLRTPLESGVDALRDAILFELKSDNVTRLEIRAPDDEAVVLVSKGGDNGATAGWTMAEPAGLNLDPSGQGHVAVLLGLRAHRFMKLAALTDTERAALDAPGWSLTLTTQNGAKIVVLLAARADGTAVGRIVGHDEAFTLTKWSATNAMTGLAELRDRRVVTARTEALTELVVPLETGRASVKRVEGRWTLAMDAGAVAADPDDYIKKISGIRASRWARPEERAEAAAALETPAIRASLMAGALATDLRFSAPFEREGQQLRWGSVGDGAFLVTDFAAKKLETTVEALRLKRLFEMELQEVARVTVKRSDESSYTLGRATPEAPLGFDGDGANRATNVDEAATLAAAIVELTAASRATAQQWREAAGPEATVTVVVRAGQAFTATIRQTGTPEAPLVRVDRGRLSGEIATLSAQRVREILAGPKGTADGP